MERNPRPEPYGMRSVIQTCSRDTGCHTAERGGECHCHTGKGRSGARLYPRQLVLRLRLIQLAIEALLVTGLIVSMAAAIFPSINP